MSVSQLRIFWTLFGGENPHSKVSCSFRFFNFCGKLALCGRPVSLRNPARHTISYVTKGQDEKSHVVSLYREIFRPCAVHCVIFAVRDNKIKQTISGKELWGTAECRLTGQSVIVVIRTVAKDNDRMFTITTVRGSGSKAWMWMNVKQSCTLIQNWIKRIAQYCWKARVGYRRKIELFVWDMRNMRKL